jgi:hypothetical protein
MDKRKRADSHSQRERERERDREREEPTPKQFNTINATNGGSQSQLAST